MREQHTPMRAVDIVQALGLTKAAWMTLKRMVDAGVLVRVARGVYAVAEDEQ